MIHLRELHLFRMVDGCHLVVHMGIENGDFMEIHGEHVWTCVIRMSEIEIT